VQIDPDVQHPRASLTVFSLSRPEKAALVKP
jgi:hypothetical protein